MSLAISPDARWVLAMPDVAKSTERLFLTPTGPGESRLLPAGKIAEYYDSFWLSDGKRVLHAAAEAGRPRRLFIQELSDGEPRAVTPEGVVTFYNTISPDGEWVAASIFEPGAVYALYPLDGGEPHPIRGLQSNETPLGWSGDGRSMFVRLSGQTLLPARIVKLDVATGRRDPWLSLTPLDPAGVINLADINLSADGRGYVYTYGRQVGDLYLVEGLR